MHRAWMTAYPWDIIDDDLQITLDRMQGEWGITGLSLWTSIPPTTQLRVRNIEPKFVRTRGGLFFHPSENQYESTRCKPIASSKVKGRDPIEKIVNACTQRGLEYSLIVSAAMSGRLVHKHPEMACKNRYDDSSQIGLCLSNPDVQSYLNSLISDISSKYNPASVIVTDFISVWTEAYLPDLQTTAIVGNLERALLAMCFCESCYQRATQAGVDIEMVKRSVKVLIQKSFEQGVADNTSLDCAFSDNAPISAYHNWRYKELSDLLRNLSEACNCELLLDRSVYCSSVIPPAHVDLDIPDGVIERMNRPELLKSILHSSARRIELRIPSSLTMGTHGPELISLISQAAESGCHSVHFDHYGLLPDIAMTTIKQAIRFARRKMNRS